MELDSSTTYGTSSDSDANERTPLTPSSPTPIRNRLLKAWTLSSSGSPSSPASPPRSPHIRPSSPTISNLHTSPTAARQEKSLPNKEPLSNSSGWKVGTAPVPIPQGNRNSVSSPTVSPQVPTSPIPSPKPPPKLSYGYRGSMNYISSPDLSDYALSRSSGESKSVPSNHSSTNSSSQDDSDIGKKIKFENSSSESNSLRSSLSSFYSDDEVAEKVALITSGKKEESSSPPTKGLQRSMSPPVTKQHLRSRSNEQLPVSKTPSSKSLPSRKVSLKTRYSVSDEPQQKVTFPILYVQVIEAFDLAIPEKGSGKTYVTVTLDEVQLKTTSVKARSTVEWGDEFVFQVKQSIAAVEMQVWQSQSKGDDLFLGEVNIPLYSLEHAPINEDWFPLRPIDHYRKGSLRKINENSDEAEDNPLAIYKAPLGRLHLKLYYSGSKKSTIQATVAISKQYGDFVQLLLNPKQTLVTAICEAVDTYDLEELAAALVGLFDYHCAVSLLIRSRLEKEVSKAANETILFQNSVAIRFASFYCIMIGIPYLKELLSSLIDDVVKFGQLMPYSKLEIDPKKVPVDEIEANTDRLCQLTKKFLYAICGSVSQCPTSIRNTIYLFKTITMDKFPGNGYIKAIGRLFFTRFLCAAIVSPQQYGIVEDSPNPECSHVLANVARIIQHIATQSTFKETQPHMQPLNTFITKMTPLVMQFLDALAIKAPKEQSFFVFNSTEVLRDVLTLHSIVEAYLDKMIATNEHDKDFPVEALKSSISDISTQKQSFSQKLYNVNRKDLEKKGAIKIPADLAYTKYQREQAKMKRLSIAGQVSDGEQVGLNSSPKWESESPNPCTVVEKLLGNLLEIYASLEGKWNVIKTSKQFRQFAKSLAELQKIEPNDLTDELERMAFWINLHNLLVIHLHILMGPPTSLSVLKSYLSVYKYQIGHNFFSIDDIVAILRGQPMKKKTSNLENYKANIDTEMVGSVHFVLSYLNQHTNFPQVFKADTLQADLRKAGELFLRNRVRVDIQKKKIVLPRIFEICSEDFGKTKKDILIWLFKFLNTTKRLDLLLLLEKEVYKVTYQNIPVNPPIVGLPSKNASVIAPPPPVLNEVFVPTRRDVMKTVDNCQTTLYLLWKTTSASLLIQDIVKTAKLLQAVFKDVCGFAVTEKGTTSDMVLLELIGADEVRLTEGQLQTFPTRKDDVALLLKGISTRVTEIDCVLTHFIMSLNDNDVPHIYPLVVKVQKALNERLTEVKRDVVVVDTNLSQLKEVLLSEILQVLEYLKLIASDLKVINIEDEDDQKLLLIISVIMKYLRKQLEAPSVTMAPLELTDADRVLRVPVAEFNETITRIKNTTKILLVWIYQRFKTLSLSISYSSLSQSLVETGVQVRNMRNALKYIHGKKAKAINQGSRLSIHNERTLTMRLIKASRKAPTNANDHFN